jgi:hypothetical protein
VIGMSNFDIFYEIKVEKHIWGTCCHLAAETGNLFSLISCKNNFVHISKTKELFSICKEKVFLPA